MSDLPPPPAPPGAVPPQQSPPHDPWRKYLWIGLASGIILWVAGILAMAAGGPPINDEPSDSGSSASCTTVDMRPLTAWDDPVTVVELEATAPNGRTMYAWGIEDAVWVASTDSPDGGAVTLPVNASARAYDPVLGADVDVFESGFADAAGEAESALAGCG